MSTTRRRALGAALAAPLLTRFTGQAWADEVSADRAPDALGTISDGWVEVRWTANDAQRMAVDLNLLIEGAPALVDFGAGDTVYAALKPGQQFSLSASKALSWFVQLGGEPYATGRNTRAEGWAHVMDKQRATAIAVAGFGGQAQDRIDRAGYRCREVETATRSVGTGDRARGRSVDRREHGASARAVVASRRRSTDRKRQGG